ncbi:MAG: glycosyltransferase family 2 protein [Aquiluna sp.]|nr:glycosyltransferase family 2 protein [Aquiluna sp.]MCF8545824.1 glycosyltransferase family 2 protein [Aquiluna sp.]
MDRTVLTLGYSTIAQRVGDMVAPPVHKNWNVSLVIQNPENLAWRGEGLAELMLRDDITIQELSTIGVAKSRNRSIWLARGKYLVFGDDDVEFQVEGLEEAIEFLDTHPQYSLLLGQAIDETGSLRKQYPNNRQALTKYNSARAATYEMIIRVESVRSLGVFFDEEFGAGASNYLGDEYIFIVDLLAAGGHAVFMPITIAMHPAESSGSRWGSAKDRRARAVIFSRVFGNKAVLVRFVFGLRRLKELGSIKNLILFTFGR